MHFFSFFCLLCLPSFKESKVGNAEAGAGRPCGVAQGGSAVQERRRRSRKGDRKAKACKEDVAAEGAQDAKAEKGKAGKGDGSNKDVDDGEGRGAA